MKKALGRKQNIDNEKWVEVMDNIEEYITKEELDQLTEKTLKEIKQKTRGKKTAYAWSGGKDSLVLGHICERAGIKDSMLGICDLEYPAFIDWINENEPEGLEIINTGQDLEWLAKNPKMLFPKDSKVASRWYSIVQHKAQNQYYKKHKLDILILGRRKADGNYVGKGDNIYTDKKGTTRYSPLSEWSHEMMLAYIHYYQLEMPPIYSWENGYKCGTHPWAARQHTGSIENGWREIYSIDKEIVNGAAEIIESAKEFREGLKHEDS